MMKRQNHWRTIKVEEQAIAAVFRTGRIFRGRGTLFDSLLNFSEMGPGMMLRSQTMQKEAPHTRGWRTADGTHQGSRHFGEAAPKPRA
jgi:hypothetical protein